MPDGYSSQGPPSYGYGFLQTYVSGTAESH